MDNKTEMIQEQMDETRTSLSDKLGMLEQQVVDTMQGASNAVSDTVGSVKDTVQAVKDSVQDTVDAVKNTFDLKHQVDLRPWTMLAGATALGCLGGYLLCGRRASTSMRSGASTPQTILAGATRNGASERHRLVASEIMRGPDAAGSAPSPGPSGIAFGGVFQAEISKMKALAVGTLLGIARDMVTQSLPTQLRQKVGDVIDDITSKLGGQTLQGPVLPSASESESFGKP